MPKIQSQCPDCNHMMNVSFGDTVIDGSLCWSASETCTNCDYATDQDDIGALPQHLRAIELKENGTWQLILSDTPSTVTLKILREALNLSLAEVKSLLDSKLRGTHAEMRYLSQELKQSTGEPYNLTISRIE